MAAATSSSVSLKEYLKRYENSNEEEKKKKKKKKKLKPEVKGVLVVDEDPVWQKPVNLEEEENENDSAEEEKPQIDEDIEVKRMKRLDLLRSKRPYHGISEDGSGWVPVSDAPQSSNYNDERPDLPTPRQRRDRNDTPSPEREQKPIEPGRGCSGASPPHRRQRYISPLPDPEVGPVHSGNLSPDISPPRRVRDKSRFQDDLSPPRNSRKDFERQEFHVSSDPDLSPPRKSRKGIEKPELHVFLDPDLSPPRKGRKESERLELRVSLDPDLSPPRKTKKDVQILESRASLEPDLSLPRKSRKEPSSLKEKPKTGLISREEIKAENERTKKDDWLRFKEMDPSISGRGAEPVYRDKIKGERISKEDFLKSQKREEKPKEKKLEWGKGLAQKREIEAKQQELELEKEKPFARTRDDPELDKMLKERVRWGDPMAHLVKRNHNEPILPDLGDNEKMKESGFIIPQEIPSHSWIKRGLDAAPNRYGIRPGRHWDGVDRSNGFEKQSFKRMNEKQASEREAYLWSVSDM